MSHDPAAGDHRIVLRMHGVDDVHGGRFALLAFDLFVLSEEVLLRFRIRLAGDELWFLVDVTEAVKQRCHTAFGVRHPEGLLDPVGDSFGRQVQVILQMHIPNRQLLFVECTRAAAQGNMVQRLGATLAVACEMIANRVGIDL